jgi:hypothetical protein
MLGEVTHAFESILERLSASMHSPAEVSLTAINHATTMGCRAGIIAAVTIVVRAAVVAQRRRCPAATRPACVQVVELRAYIPTVPALLDELGARVAAVCDQYEVRRPARPARTRAIRYEVRRCSPAVWSHAAQQRENRRSTHG